MTDSSTDGANPPPLFERGSNAFSHFLLRIFVIRWILPREEQNEEGRQDTAPAIGYEVTTMEVSLSEPKTTVPRQ